MPLAPASLLGQSRTVEHAARSTSNPSAEIRVTGELAYLGPVRYDVGSGARVEAFGTFSYPRLEMARLGTHEYLHQTWALAQFSLFEIPAVQAFLRERRLSTGPRWLVDRSVRVVDSAGRHEVIFFYLEAAELHDSTITYGGAPVGPSPPPTPPAPVLNALRERAAAAFRVIDQPRAR